jgi:hypothetical protein
MEPADSNEITSQKILGNMLARQNRHVVLICNESKLENEFKGGSRVFWVFFYEVFSLLFLDPEIKFSKGNCLPVEMSEINMDYSDGG